MSDTRFVRASSPAQPITEWARPQGGLEAPDLQAVAQHMYSLMLRNIATEGFVFSDPVTPGNFSKPGCVLAAPSYPANTPGINQDYVFNWTRDAAITALELCAAAPGGGPSSTVDSLIDYVTFAQTCQNNATPTLAHACYTIDGRSRPWTEQADGPAIQTIARCSPAGSDSTRRPRRSPPP
jgi:glucoamylase